MKIKIIFMMVLALILVNNTLAWDAYCQDTQCTIYIKEADIPTARHYYVAWVSNMQGSNELVNETVCLEKIGNEEDFMKFKEKGCVKVNLNTEKSFPFTLNIPDDFKDPMIEAGYKFTSGDETKQVLFNIIFLDDGYDAGQQKKLFIGILIGFVALITGALAILKKKK